MVNAKNYAFKVHPQQPNCQASTQAHGAVINCRKPGGKRTARDAKEVQSHHVTFVNVEAALKRKRDQEEETGSHHATSSRVSPQSDGLNTRTSTTPSVIPDSSICHQRLPAVKLPRPKKTKVPSKGVDLDCWFTILSFSDPAQLLEMRIGIPSCFHFLRDNPTLWKHSRNYHYGSDLPEPPSELTEFQYADLRHGHGCQDHTCTASSTRKTYWAFLRRWCKKCLQDKIYKEHEAVAVLRGASGGEDLSFLHSCLPAGIYDSWGNFVGCGPATTHALKTIYLKSDVHKVIDGYNVLKARHKDPATWAAELHAWFEPQAKVVEERRVFAKEMEGWEELMRSARSQDYTIKKAARKLYFQAKASELDPALTARELECCPSYRRAIRIPKDPNSTSWLQLKPKLEKEAAELKAKGGPPDERPATSSNSGTSTPMSVISVVERPQPQSQSQQQYALPSIGRTLGFRPPYGLYQSTHGLYGPSPPYRQGFGPPHGQGFALPHIHGIAQPYNQSPAPSHSQAIPHSHNHPLAQRHVQILAPLQRQVHAGLHSQTHASPSHSLPPPHSHMF
jgi:hypothetical protein